MVILLVIIVAVILVFFWSPFETADFSGSRETPFLPADSFETEANSFQAALAVMPAFDPQKSSFKTENLAELQSAKQSLLSFKEKVEAKNFSEKNAVLSLIEIWISRVELAIEWNKLQSQNQLAFFSGTESDEAVCAQKSFFVSMREPIKNALNALKNAEQKHNSFASAFPVQAGKVGFEETIDLSEGIAGLQNQLEAVTEIVGACS